MAITSAERGREVRQRLVRAATELIVERGWTGVSTRLVAERAGVTAGLVHYHFASLRSLLTDAALTAIREAIASVEPLLERARTPEEVLDRLLASLAGYTGGDATSVLFTETYLAATRDIEVRRAVADVLADFRRPLARRLDEHGVATPDATAAVVAAAVDGVMLHRALDPSVTAESVAPVLRRILARDHRNHTETTEAREDRE
ncbi:TetR/AcrR family transcriptional regulator [Halostreptopolyspora alba]|uniref:TetR/AcrR family transcriptional regulator n=1 Tax=Halostreptopolyspora alba TaxID=2487137 RepID=A0A3N0EBQ4_9ACTN|nr:TetR/AcrR family transcriptional regulator [Nocardiopsaceae bacterium YIM 96095]